MRRLFNLFRSPGLQFPPDQEIDDEQFLDKDGKVHMDTYLSFYDREISVEATVNETACMDIYTASFYSAPASTDERHWDQAHGPGRYEGGLKSFDVKPGIKRIGVRAFSYNINLKDITLPEGLVIIDKEAFSACSSLQKITIPSTVRFIGKDAFDCKVEVLTLLCITPPEIATLGVDKNCRIYVPQAAMNDYKNHSMWRRYSKQLSIY